jgi:pyruvate dehydrogenase E2 component (dihydrolipoamide acetyltransferase)
MAEKVLMLALSPTMEKGTIVKWRKGEGERVSSGDVLCEVETDKAVMEYESVNEGTLLRLLVPEGKDAKVGEPIAVVGQPGEDISRVLDELEAGAEKAEGEPGHAAEKTAGKIRGGEPLYPAAAAGRAKVRAAVGRRERIPPEGIPPEGVYPEGLPPEGLPPEGRLPDGVRASPLARELAERQRIDIRTIAGSGPEGRVVKRDVEAAVRGAAGLRDAAAAGVAAKAKPGAGVSAETPFVEIPVSGKRRVIAKRLAESMYSAPHYYLKTVAAVDGLLRARKTLNEGRTYKVSLNSFIMRFAAEALKIHPAVNASWRGETIARFQRADIGLAVAQPDGLITPIVRDCGNKGILAIEEELKTLIERALKGTLKPEDYTGATFTISNLGSYDVTEFTAIINPPGSAILAVGKAEKVPVAGEGGGIGIETRMALTLSCDHRVIDGAEGALFLKDLKGLIEYPAGMLY